MNDDRYDLLVLSVANIQHDKAQFRAKASGNALLTSRIHISLDHFHSSRSLSSPPALSTYPSKLGTTVFSTEGGASSLVPAGIPCQDLIENFPSGSNYAQIFLAYYAMLQFSIKNPIILDKNS